MFDRQFFDAWSPRVLSVLRMVTAYAFMLHGTAKLFGFPHVAALDNLQIMSLMGVAGMLEVVGGALLLVGWFTRPTAFVMSGFMAVAYFMAHASQGNVLVPFLNGGESAVLFSFTFLYLSFAGAGAWSLDARRSGAAS